MTTLTRGPKRVVLTDDYYYLADGETDTMRRWDQLPFSDLPLDALFSEFFRRRGFTEERPAPKAKNKGGRPPTMHPETCKIEGCNEPRVVVASGRKRSLCKEHQRQYDAALWQKRRYGKGEQERTS